MRKCQSGPTASRSKAPPPASAAAKSHAPPGDPRASNPVAPKPAATVKSTRGDSHASARAASDRARRRHDR
jgi:hypothetical protein